MTNFINNPQFVLNFQPLKKTKDMPSFDDFHCWIHASLACCHKNKSEITVRLVDKKESENLNQQFRKKNGPTNILSFLYQDYPLIGDLVICAPLVAEEAKYQKKPLTQHWARLTIHGILHLCGFDHQEDSEAIYMENLEMKLLKQLGFDPRYE